MIRSLTSFIFLLLVSICHAQDAVPTGMRITFSDDTPTANLAFATEPTIRYSGGNMLIAASTVGSLSYPMSTIEKVEHLSPKESYPIIAHSSPLNPDKYYATFYSGQWSYSLPEGVIAYIGTVNDLRMKLTDIGTRVIPSGVAVILISDKSDYVLQKEDCASGVKDNHLEGVDEITEQSSDYVYFVLSQGEEGDKKDVIGFYRLYSNISLQANKAFFRMSADETMSAKAVFFFDDVETSIGKAVITERGGEKIYNLAGQLLSIPQKGINIINGRKVIK